MVAPTGMACRMGIRTRVWMSARSGWFKMRALPMRMCSRQAFPRKNRSTTTTVVMTRKALKAWMVRS